MAESSAATSLILGLALIFTSVITMGNACEQTVIGGGCPDISKCFETCRPCYRGIGFVGYYCRSGYLGQPYEQCVCTFEKGAPCPPPGPPRCPRPWPPPPLATATNATNNHIHNGTLLIK